MLSMNKFALRTFMAEYAMLHDLLLNGWNEDAEKLAQSLFSDLSSMGFEPSEMPDFVIMGMPR